MGAHGQCVFVCKHRSLLTNTTHLCCSEGSSRLGLDFQFHSARADPVLGVLTEILKGLEHQEFLQSNTENSLVGYAGAALLGISRRQGENPVLNNS